MLVGISLRIQCLGGKTVSLFFFGVGGGERSLSGVLVFLYQIQCLGGENCVLFVFFGGSGVCAECWYFFTDSVLGRGKLCPFFLEGGGAETERSAGVSLRIQCLGGENCILFFFWGERSLSGVLVFLYGFSAWEGKTVYFFFGGERSLSGVLVFLYGFSAWEGKTVSLFFLEGGRAEPERSTGTSLRIQCLGGENCVLFFWGGGSGVCAECWCFFTDSVLGRGTLCLFFVGGGSGV